MGAQHSPNIMKTRERPCDRCLVVPVKEKWGGRKLIVLTNCDGSDNKPIAFVALWGDEDWVTTS